MKISVMNTLRGRGFNCWFSSLLSGLSKSRVAAERIPVRGGHQIFTPSSLFNFLRCCIFSEVFLPRYLQCLSCTATWLVVFNSICTCFQSLLLLPTSKRKLVLDLIRLNRQPDIIPSWWLSIRENLSYTWYQEGEMRSRHFTRKTFWKSLL